MRRAPQGALGSGGCVTHTKAGGASSIKRPPEPDPTLCPGAKQGQLALLGIEAYQRPHNRLQAADLVLRIAGVELATLNPLRIALLSQCELALRFGNLLGKGDYVCSISR